MSSSARDQFEKQLHEALDAVKEQREKNTHSQKEINELKQQAINQKCGMLYNKERLVGEKESAEHPLVRQIEQEYKTKHPSPSPCEFYVYRYSFYLPLEAFFLCSLT